VSQADAYASEGAFVPGGTINEFPAFRKYPTLPASLSPLCKNLWQQRKKM